MSDIKVTRYENNNKDELDSLSKMVYCFDMEGLTLRYTSCWWYFRNTPDELWGDKWEKPLSYDDWSNSPKFGRPALYNSVLEAEEKYKEYCDAMNPVCNQTSYGRCKAGGVSCRDISILPDCPNDVAEEAMRQLIFSITVKYKV